MVRAAKLSAIAAVSALAVSGAAAALQSSDISHAHHLLSHRSIVERQLQNQQKPTMAKLKKRLGFFPGDALGSIVNGISKDLGLNDGLGGQPSSASPSSNSPAPQTTSPSSSSNNGGGSSSNSPAPAPSASAATANNPPASQPANNNNNNSNSNSSANSNQNHPSTSASNSNNGSNHASDTNHNSGSSNNANNAHNANNVNNTNNNNNNGSNPAAAQPQVAASSASSASPSSINSIAAAASASASAAVVSLLSSASASQASAEALASATAATLARTTMEASATATGVNRASSSGSSSGSDGTTKVVVPIVVIAASVAVIAVAWTLIRRIKKRKTEHYDPRLQPVESIYHHRSMVSPPLTAGGAAFAVGGAAAGLVRDRPRRESNYVAGRPMSSLTEEEGNLSGVPPPMHEVAPYAAVGSASSRLRNYGSTHGGGEQNFPPAYPVTDSMSIDGYAATHQPLGGAVTPFSDEHGAYDVNYYDGSSTAGYNNRATRGVDVAAISSGAGRAYSPYADLQRGDGEYYDARSSSGHDPFADSKRWSG